MSHVDKEFFITDLYSRYFGKMRNMCINRVKKRHELYDFADDAVQDTFLMLYERYPRLKDHPNIAGWLFETCKHLFFRKVSKYQAEQRKQAASIDSEKASELKAADDTALYIEQITNTEILEKIDQSLSAKEKMVFQYITIHGLTVQEIAIETNASENAISLTLFRIRTKAETVLAIYS